MSDGALYVEVMPSTRGIKGSIEGDLNGQFQAAEKTGEGFFSRMGKLAKGTAVVVGGMVAAIGGLALTGGISRALNIEDAQAKLKGLGNDTATVEAIMTDALNAVRGTAFGLDSAATVAASAVAAGIKPGQELERYLRLTADAATIAGTSLDEMGSILNKVTTSGKVYTDNLNQLADRGIPIFQWLQDEYGVTADELSKMVQEGKVDAETFRKVIEENIGGAALASGDTTRGAFANMRAALSRLGVVFVGDGLNGAKTFFNEITVILDGVAARIKPFVETVQTAIGGLFNIEGMGDRFLALIDSIDIGSLVSQFTESRGSFIDAGVQVIGSLIEGMISAIPQIVGSVATLVSQIVVLVNTYGPSLISGAATLFLGLVTGLIQVLPDLISTIIGLVPTITVALLSVLPNLVEGAIQLFMGIVQAIITVIPQIITTLVELIPTIVTALVNLIPALIDGAIQLFMAIVEAIPMIIPVLIQAIIDLLPTLITTILSLIPQLIEGAIQLFIAIVEAIPIIIPALIDGIVNLLPTLITTIIGLIPMLIETAIKLFTSLVEAIPIIVPKLIDAVVTIGPKLVDAVIKMVPKLLDAGKQLITGLGDGIASMGKWLMDQLGKVINGAIQWGKDLLGIKSPSKVFFEIGAYTGEGLADGIVAQSATVRSAVDHMIHIPDSAAVGIASSQASTAGPSAGDRWEMVLDDGTAISGYMKRKAAAVVGDLVSPQRGGGRRA